MILRNLKSERYGIMNIYTTMEMENQLIYLKGVQILAICSLNVNYQKAFLLGRISILVKLLIWNICFLVVNYLKVSL